VKADVQQFVKRALTAPAPEALSLPAAIPLPDFSQFGAITTQPLSRIKKLSGAHLQRIWQTVPQVTQFDQADITELEAFRKQQVARAGEQAAKMTLLPFILKAVVAALRRYPEFNASLDASGAQLILKSFINIGVAMDTSEGLVVPVLRDVDRKSVTALSTELADLSQRARNRKLSAADMQGGCFTVSSLGGIGGTGFTPIVNAPEVAILGVARAAIQPVYQADQFVPRLMLPLALSYDHRVIDGAQGARCARHLSELLSDIRQLLL
jgi:pyruvate dehydrogenase E2 component (dihydrolipoamide acetyltransferase)